MAACHLHFIPLLAAGAVIAGCALPTRQPVSAPPTPPAWSTAVPSSADNGPSAEKPWWEQFGTSELPQLVEVALSRNADLAVLAERIELARARGRASVAGARPSAAASTGWREGREQTRETGFETESLMPWVGGASVSWELDWLGKWRARQAAANARIQASRADYDAGRLLVATEVVATWLRIQRGHHEADILARSLDRQQRILEILEDREGAGLIDRTASERQTGEASDLQRSLAEARMETDLASRQLDRLLGETHGAGTYPKAPLPSSTHVHLPAVLPTDVLSRRPDLLAAEARLRAAYAMDQSEKLNLYPSLALRLGGVTMTGSLTDPFRSWMAEVGPHLEIPLWDPHRQAAAKIADARAQVAAAEYRSAALRAVEEVESALITFHRIREQLGWAREAAQRAGTIRSITEDRLASGIVSQLELLEDERRSLAAVLTVNRLETQTLTAAMALVRSLGGLETIEIVTSTGAELNAERFSQN